MVDGDAAMLGELDGWTVLAVGDDLNAVRNVAALMEPFINIVTDPVG